MLISTNLRGRAARYSINVFPRDKHKLIQPVGCITPTTYACARESSDLQAAGLGRKQTPFMVPFSQDNHFVAREDIISDIDRILETEQRVALTGLGGVG